MGINERVLYVVHSIPTFDKTGTPYAAWRIAKLAKQKYGVDVAFLTGIGSADKKPVKMLVESIPVYVLPKIDQYSNFFEDSHTNRSEYLRMVDAAIRDFRPTILHIYNFVNMSYQIMLLKTRYPELKILRTVTHTEDVCFCIDPVLMDSIGAEYCLGPFPIDKCAKHYHLISDGKIDNVRQCIEEHYVQLNTYFTQYLDGVIFSTHAFHDYMAKIFTMPPNRWIFPHGIVPVNESPQKRTYNSSCAGPLLLTFFGGIGIRKGLSVLIEAIRKRPDIMQFIHVQITGTMGESLNSRNLQELYSLFPTQIEILGRLNDDDMDKVMRSADVAVLPSFFETFNITLRELLVRGTPSIVSDTYGSEIIQQGVNGFVFPRGDVDSFLEIIQHLIFDREKVCRLQDGARRTAVVTIEEECRNVLAVYRELLAGAK